jgi:ribosomal protein L20A (L18A)
MGPKKTLKLIRVHGRLENVPDEVKIRLAGNYEELRRVFLEPDLYRNYGINYGELQEQGTYDFLCEERDFSRERAVSRVHYKAFKSEQKTVYREEISVRPEELETIVAALRELGLSYEETVKLMSEVTKDAETLRSLWGKPGAGRRKGSGLIKLGASLIAFPIPTIGIKKSLGATLIVAGLIRERMKHSHVTDVYSTFKDVNRELQKLRQKSV